MENLNKPYIKQYDEKGQLLPLPKGGYINNHPNRRQRRQYLQNRSFTGNQKGKSLTVSQNLKYERVYQHIVDQFGRVIKTIKHYLAK